MKMLFLVAPPNRGLLREEWDLADVGSVSPPLGVLSLAAVLKREGHAVELVDADCHPVTVDDFGEHLRSARPDVIGFSFMTGSCTSAERYARRAREVLPGVPLVAGGVHVTALPEETLARGPYDIGVVGEGEATLPDLLDCLARRGDPADVKGIVFRDAAGAVRRTPARPLIARLDDLPFPDWSLVKFREYRLTPIGIMGSVAVPLITTRGCPGRCTFCANGAFGSAIRAHAPEYMIDMIESIVGAHGIREFLFYDDTFVALRKRVFDFCEGLARRRLAISWSCCARVDCVTEEMLRAMRAAGCWQIEYGIESGCPEILDSVNKKIRTEQVRDVLRWTRRAGIQTRGNFIFGLPGDSVETIRRTIDFACSIDLDYFQQSFLTPYPGSEIHERALREGTFDPDWDRMNNFAINYVPRGMRRDELEALSREAFRRFYLRPRVVLAHLGWLLRHPKLLYNYGRAAGSFIKTIGRGRGAGAEPGSKGER